MHVICENHGLSPIPPNHRLIMNKREVELLSQEIELLMQERVRLLRVTGMAAVLVSNTEANSLPPAVVNAAEVLSELLNALPEETLKDALESVDAHPDAPAAN